MISSLTTLVTPTPSPEFNPDTVTPGFWGFAITLFVAVCVVLLIMDMVRRVRAVNLRAQVKAKLDEEQAAEMKNNGSP